MAELNLSQSMGHDKEPKAQHFFDMGFVVSGGIFLLVILGWGGLRFYMNSLDKKVAALDAVVVTNTSELQGEAVNRVTDFDDRMSQLAKNLAENTDPAEQLRSVEGLMVPKVVLTQYEYNKDEQVITFSAKTSDFRFIAEQIMSLKSGKDFSTVTVDAIGRDADGNIIFTLKAHF